MAIEARQASQVWTLQYRQSGQAVVETLAGLALLALLATAAASVGRFQWQGLEAAQAARSAVFRYALGERGVSVDASARLSRATRAADFPGPGGARALGLRRELGVEDRGMVRADVTARVSPHRHHGPGLVLRRHAVILADAGHAASDARVQQRIAGSRAAWAHAARASHAPARVAQARLQRLDRGWGRPAPDLDWLAPWSDLIPADRVDRGARRAGRRP